MFEFPPVPAHGADARPRFTSPEPAAPAKPAAPAAASPAAVPAAPPLRCEDVRGDAFAFADGELSADRGAAMRAHAGRCAGCRAAMDQDARFVRFVRRHVPRIAAPPELRDRVREQLGGRPRAPAPGGTS